jgi:hypothetical protein
MASPQKIELYHPTDFTIPGRTEAGNPYLAEIKGVFTGPDGGVRSIPGFYDGKEWKVRFAPDVEGLWRYRIEASAVGPEDIEGKVECIANGNPAIHGGILVWEQHPHHFIYQDGTPYYMMAYEADWLWAPDFGDPKLPEATRLVKTIREYGFNHVLVNTYAHDTRWCPGKTSDRDFGPPAAYLWEGSNEQPDHSRMNPEYFIHYDRMMNLLMENGIGVHLFLRVYNKDVNWPENYSVEDDLYFRYIVARYQAYPNVIWDFSKEAKNEPDKGYIADRIRLIRSLDAYGRLITVHDDHVYFESQYRDTMDFLTVQQHEEFHMHGWLERELTPWPVFNSEFGYEQGPGGPEDITYRVAQSAEEFVRRAWEVVTSGTYPAYYYTYTAWDVIDQSHTPPGYGYFKNLYDFMTSVEWWLFEPYRAFQRSFGRGMRIRGEEYLIYGTKRAAAPLHMELEGDGSIRTTWMNIYTGERVENDGIVELRDGARYRVESPFDEEIPWVCHIRRG